MLSTVFRKLQSRPLLQRLIGNTLWQTADKIVRMVLGLLVGVWVARYLGPAEFGLLNFAIAFVAIFTPLAEGGLQAVVVRDLVNQPEQRASIVASAWVLRLIGSAIAIATIAVAIHLVRPEASAQLIVVTVGLTLFPLAWDVIDYDYQARMRAPPVVAVRMATLIVFSFVRVALILKQAQLLAFVWAMVLEACLTAVGLALLARRSGVLRLANASRARARELLSASWPMLLSGLSVIFYMRIDQVMLARMLGDEAVGIFSAAVRVSESWYFVPMAALTAVAPALTAAYAESRESYERKTVQFMRALLIVSVVVAVAFTLLSHWIIALLYGPSYSGAAAVLALHAWAGVFACLGLASGPWFVNSGLLKLRMLYTLAGALANVTLNIVLVPRYGVLGAAVATLVSYGVAGLWMNALGRRSRPVFALQLRAMLGG